MPEQPPSAGTSPAGDSETTAGKLARLVGMRREALLGGGEARIERQHKAGKLTARERLDLLLDPGTFQELDALVIHRAPDPSLTHYLGDGVVTGVGRVDGRRGGGVVEAYGAVRGAGQDVLAGGRRVGEGVDGAWG